MMTTKSVDALMESVKTLMIDSSKYEVRAVFLEQLLDQDLLAPWVTAVQPYPPFILENTKLWARIREVRREASRKIQDITRMEFTRLASKLSTEGETIISTLETMMTGKHAPVLDQCLNAIATHVGRLKATLTTKLDNRLTLLSHRQPTNGDWDNWFHYSVAYRRNQNNSESAFEITPSDRAQADLDSARDLEALIHDDSEEEGTASTHKHKRKRQASPGVSSRQSNYRIPKKDHHQQQREYHRDPPPHSSNNRNHPITGFWQVPPTQSSQADVPQQQVPQTGQQGWSGQQRPPSQRPGQPLSGKQRSLVFAEPTQTPHWQTGEGSRCGHKPQDRRLATPARPSQETLGFHSPQEDRKVSDKNDIHPKVFSEIFQKISNPFRPSQLSDSTRVIPSFQDHTLPHTSTFTSNHFVIPGTGGDAYDHSNHTPPQLRSATTQNGDTVQQPASPPPHENEPPWKGQPPTYDDGTCHEHDNIAKQGRYTQPIGDRDLTSSVFTVSPRNPMYDGTECSFNSSLSCSNSNSISHVFTPLPSTQETNICNRIHSPQSLSTDVHTTPQYSGAGPGTHQLTGHPPGRSNETLLTVTPHLRDRESPPPVHNGVQLEVRDTSPQHSGEDGAQYNDSNDISPQYSGDFDITCPSSPPQYSGLSQASTSLSQTNVPPQQISIDSFIADTVQHTVDILENKTITDDLITRLDILLDDTHVPQTSQVINLSNRVLDPHELVVLQKGLNFCPTPATAQLPRRSLHSSIYASTRWCPTLLHS